METRPADGVGGDPDRRLGIAELRSLIGQLHVRLDEIGAPPSPLEEVVDSTNTLRTNEYLAAKDAVSSRLISYYGQYVDALASLADSVLDVQSGLIGVLREQSAMLGRGGGGGGGRRPAVDAAATAAAGKKGSAGSRPAKRGAAAPAKRAARSARSRSKRAPGAASSKDGRARGGGGASRARGRT